MNSASGFHLKSLVPGLGCVSAMQDLSGSFQAFRDLEVFFWGLETQKQKGCSYPFI